LKFIKKCVDDSRFAVELLKAQDQLCSYFFHPTHQKWRTLQTENVEQGKTRLVKVIRAGKDQQGWLRPLCMLFYINIITEDKTYMSMGFFQVY
jgi:hypothetical protein